MEKVWWIAGGAAVGAVAVPVGLSLLGFSAIGPVAGLWRRGESVVPGVELRGASPPFSQLL